MVLFHSADKSPRLLYVLDYLFVDRLGLEYTFCTELPEQISGFQCIINYHSKTLANAWNLEPDGLLFDTEIKALESSYLPLNPQSVQFPENVDFFSALFFHLSRYEEYICQQKDEHQRFDHLDSVIYKNGFLEIPFIDIWIHQFKEKLIQDFNIPQSSFKQDNFKVQASIDVDSVFAYKGKTFIRQIGAFMKDLLTFNFYELTMRIKVLTKLSQDPNDNFDFQFQTLDKYKAQYFIQCGPYGKYDKNLSLKQADFAKIVEHIQLKGHTIGIHPSYGSNSDAENIKKEIHTLCLVTKDSIKHSRQHFLKFELPKTYRALIAAGIEHDHSMGYSKVPGFRAGTAYPFRWFDLENNSSSNFTIHPFCCMDVAFKQFMHLNVDDTIAYSKTIKERLQSIQAPFVFVFHNESLSQHRGWQGWDKVFKYWISERD